MNYSEAVHWLLAKETRHTTLFLQSSPGLGKSSVAGTVAETLREQEEAAGGDPSQIVEVVLDLTRLAPEDLSGLPYIEILEDGTRRTRYAPQPWLARACVPGVKGIICLDDLPAASEAVAKAARQLVLERRIDENRLSSGIRLMVTGNRREDKAGAMTLPSHFVNSVAIFGFDADFESWAKWYMARGYPPVILAFLRWKLDCFSQTPADKSNNNQFATPRSWTLLGSVWDYAEKRGMVLHTAEAYVGTSVGAVFHGFWKTRAALVPPDELLKNPALISDPVVYLAETPDRAYALFGALAETAADWMGQKSRNKSETVCLFLRALAHFSGGNLEFAYSAIDQFTRTQRGVKFAVATDFLMDVYFAKLQDESKVRQIMEFFQKTDPAKK